MSPGEYHHFTLSAGVGRANSQINAFDRALIDAGISDYNLVKISSILPPNYSQDKEVSINKGGLLPTAYSCIYENTIGSKIAAAVAVGIPEDDNDIGIIIKHCGHISKIEAESLARQYAIQAMNDRRLKVKTIVSTGTECIVDTTEYYCALAAVSLW